MVEYGHLADFLRTVCGLQGRRSVAGGPGRCLGTGGLADPAADRTSRRLRPLPTPAGPEARHSGTAGRMAKPVDNCSRPGARLLGCGCWSGVIHACGRPPRGV